MIQTTIKVYILPIKNIFKPKKQKFIYPYHNKDYGVEQDFLLYLHKNRGLVTNNPRVADWHYLPIFWTRWHINHNYGTEGLDEIQQEVNRVILQDDRTFTVCQYDDGPLVLTGNLTIFLSSRRNKEGIDIPILSSPHRIPFLKPSKKYKACFIGRFNTHPIRVDLQKILHGRNDVCIFDGVQRDQLYFMRFFERYMPFFERQEVRIFVKTILQSYVSLCPRGYGGSSFRFYESMQLGVLPFLIGDIDTRPFKKYIPWQEMSLYTNSAAEVPSILDRMNPKELLAMGKRASVFYKQNLEYQKWCKYVLEELRDIS